MSEQVIYHAKDRMEAGMIVELLQNEGIPAYFKGTEGGDFMTLYTGRSLYGEDVFVNSEQAEAACTILEECNLLEGE